MKTYVGLDVSQDTIAVCVMDSDGAVLCEEVIGNSGVEVCAFLEQITPAPSSIGIEAGPFSETLYEALVASGYPAVCLETRKLKAFLRAQVNKTDRNDARGIAQAVRVNLFRGIHVKTVQSRLDRSLLTGRKLLITQNRQIENHLRGTLKAFGVKIGMTTRRTFASRVQGLTKHLTQLAPVITSLLAARDLLLDQLKKLDEAVLRRAHADGACRTLMTAPGVGPIVALTYRTSMDVQGRFERTRDVGAYFGLTPRRYQSGERDTSGRISKVGDGEVRSALYEAAVVILRKSTKACALKAWGLKLVSRRGRKKAIVAVARKLSIILYRMWNDGTAFRPSKPGSIEVRAS